MKRARLVLALSAATLLCAGPALAQSNAQRGGTAVIAGAHELQPMNSLIASESWTLEFLNNALFLPLVRYARDLSLTPALAESWRMVGDTAVVFRIRRDVFWHDDRPTTAADVAFTFERMKDEKTGFPAFESFEHWKSIRVIDPYTIAFSIDRHPDPVADWVRVAIMPKHLLESTPTDKMREAAFNDAPVGNGPFKFESHRANDRWVFAANTTFSRSLGGRPNLDRVVFRIVPENAAQMTNALTGESDMLFGVRAEQVRELDAKPNLRGLMRPSTRYLMITWNAKHPPLNNPAVRKALTQSLNRAQMIQVLRAGYATIATGPISPAHWAFDKSLKPIAYDPRAAAAAFARAGLIDRNKDGVLENAQGKPFEIELKIPANNQFNRDLAEMVRADLSKVGVKINVRPVDFPTLIEDISSTARNFDAAVLALDSEMKVNLREVFHSGAMEGPFQTASYSNKEVDRLIDAAEAAFDRASAKRSYERLQKILLEEQPLTFLWYSPDLIVINERLRNVEMDVRGPLINIARWVKR